MLGAPNDGPTRRWFLNEGEGEAREPPWNVFQAGATAGAKALECQLAGEGLEKV